MMAAQLTFASPQPPAMKQELWSEGRKGGKEHLSTIEMEEEYVQSLVTGTLHRATQQPSQWPCVWPVAWAAGTYIMHSES